MSNPDNASYHLLTAYNWYDSGPEIERLEFRTLGEVYAYMVSKRIQRWDAQVIQVIQGHRVEIDDDRLQQLYTAARTEEDGHREALTEKAERAEFERLLKKYGDEDWFGEWRRER